MDFAAERSTCTLLCVFLVIILYTSRLLLCIKHSVEARVTLMHNKQPPLYNLYCDVQPLRAFISSFDAFVHVH